MQADPRLVSEGEAHARSIDEAIGRRVWLTVISAAAKDQDRPSSSSWHMSALLSLSPVHTTATAAMICALPKPRGC